MIDYGPLIRRWQGGELAPWAEQLPAQIAAGLAPERYGDLPRWLAALEDLPDLTPSARHLDRARVGASLEPGLDADQRAALRATLQRLHPWRKGPFNLFGVDIDTEWRSDWKWARLQNHIDDLNGRRVLDVGCGSGYHCWRMAGAGAQEVIGIDPTPLFVVQYWALQKYLQHPGVWVLPLGIQHVPANLQAFDSVFSMGVLYHRRSPMDHVQALRDCLRPGGQLILETLVIDGPLGATLVPEGRYARMGNVWFLPSPETLMSWLRKLKFRDVKLVDVSITRVEEQRQTEWMRFQSLADFLDPEDATRTIEGYPAPMRAVVTARAP